MPSYRDINEKIVCVWKEASPEERGDKIPLLFPPSGDSCALFVSLNPSFPEMLRERNWDHPYGIETLDKINVAQVIRQERWTQNHLPYFSPLKTVADRLRLRWAHLDVFMLRETSQKEAKAKVYDTEKRQLTGFGQKQFDLFAKALEISTPRLIVVINALASAIIKAHLPLEYDSTDGCHYARGDKTRPFFLGGMLSGMRAMDVYSRERLIWHIQQRLRQGAHFREEV